MALLFSIRVLLARENKRRDAEPADDIYDDIYVMRVDEDGNRTEAKVSKVRARSLWQAYLQAHVITRAGVFGFNRSTE